MEELRPAGTGGEDWGEGAVAENGSEEARGGVAVAVRWEKR